MFPPVNLSATFLEVDHCQGRDLAGSVESQYSASGACKTWSKFVACRCLTAAGILNPYALRLVSCSFQ